MSLDEKTEKFHKTNGGLDFSLFIDPYNSIRPCHDDFPDDFLDDFMGFKQSILRYFGGIGVEFKLDKIAGTHPEVVYMPAFKNISKIFPKKKPNKGPLRINHIDPTTMMPISHQLKRFPQRSTLLYLHFLDGNIL